MSTKNDDFKEIGHCGGQFTFNIKTLKDGNKGISYGIQHSRPVPAAFFGISALPQGLPMGTLNPIGHVSDLNLLPGCYAVFVASDSQGKFGHKCPECEGYWRSGGASIFWGLTCPYCGNKFEAHDCLSESQLRYVKACCVAIEHAIGSGKDGEYMLDMDEVADAVGKETKKPAFYYAEESQQNKYKCSACGHFNDILGRYGYCSNCGTHNVFTELEIDIKHILERINTIDSEDKYSACVKDAVSVFDSFGRQIAKQLVKRIPMAQSRQKKWNKQLFHKLQECAEDLEREFDIYTYKILKEDEIEFAKLMFHRRHVYEHNGGEVDEKYIRDSGDTSVRPKQFIRESASSAKKISEIIIKMAENIHKGFHDIFPPQAEAIKLKRS